MSAAMGTAGATPGGQVADTKTKILVVDDDEDIVWMLTAVLRKGYDVVTATDGRAALKVLEQGPVAGIIADHMMPGMSGVELLDRSHELQPAAARILITASERVNVLRDAVNQARVHRFLSKPLRLTELPNLLEDAIREAHLEAENTRLVEELGNKNRELNEANERLEGEVRQRTRELQQAVEQLEELALRDGLTGLYNHRFLQESLDAELSRAERHGTPLGLLFIDVDHFKSYNDNHGHPAGDRLLWQLAGVLTGGRQSGRPLSSRKSDVVARYGGEEFVMVLPQTNYEGTLIKAERLRAAVAEFAFEHGHTQPLGHVSVSIGVAAYPEHGKDRATLIEVADKQLYRAKREGRDRVCHPPEA